METTSNDPADDLPRSPHQQQAMRDFVARLAQENEAHTSALLEVSGAIARLHDTESGRRAFAAFRKFLSEADHGLTTKDWHALAILCAASGYLPNHDSEKY